MIETSYSVDFIFDRQEYRVDALTLMPGGKIMKMSTTIERFIVEEEFRAITGRNPDAQDGDGMIELVEHLASVKLQPQIAFRYNEYLGIDTLQPDSLIDAAIAANAASEIEQREAIPGWGEFG